MATTGTTLINDIASRVRDATQQLNATDSPPTTTTGRAFLLTLINHASIFVNLAMRLLIGTSDLFLSPSVAIYDLTASAGSDYGGKVVGCFVSGVGEIDGPVDFRALGRANRTWLTTSNATMTAPLGWAPIGRTLIAFVPTTVAQLIDVTIRYVAAPSFTTNEANTLAIPDSGIEYVARLAAMFSSIKTRQLTNWQARMDEFTNDLKGRIALTTTGGKAD